MIVAPKLVGIVTSVGAGSAPPANEDLFSASRCTLRKIGTIGNRPGTLGQNIQPPVTSRQLQSKPWHGNVNLWHGISGHPSRGILELRTTQLMLPAPNHPVTPCRHRRMSGVCLMETQICDELQAPLDGLL